MTFAEKLQRALDKSGMTRSELADKAGISRPIITNYLKGEYKAKQNNIFKLAKALSISESELIEDNLVSEEYVSAAQAKTDSKISIDAAKATLAAAGIVVGAAIPSTLLAVLATMSAVKLGKVESYAKYLAKEDDEPGDNTESSGGSKIEHP